MLLLPLLLHLDHNGEPAHHEWCHFRERRLHIKRDSVIYITRRCLSSRIFDMRTRIFAGFRAWRAKTKCAIRRQYYLFLLALPGLARDADNLRWLRRGSTECLVHCFGVNREDFRKKVTILKRRPILFIPSHPNTRDLNKWKCQIIYSSRAFVMLLPS